MKEPKGKFFLGHNGRLARSRLLVVEGPDDAYFFDELLKVAGADESAVGIIYMENNNVKKHLGLLLKSAEFDSGLIQKVAYIVDSDDDVRVTHREVQRAFSTHGISVSAPAAFVRHGSVDIAYTTVPSPDSSGSLESLCLMTLSRDIRLSWVKELVWRCEGIFGTPLDKRLKRWAHIFLSCNHQTKARSVGRSFGDGVFPANHPCLGGIKDFVAELIR